MQAQETGARRVVIEEVSPQVDGGRFAVKRIQGDNVLVEAAVFADGHDELRSILSVQAPGAGAWSETDMRPAGNDRWRAEFVVDQVGEYRFKIEAWPDAFRTWSRDLERCTAAGVDVGVELQTGAALLHEAAKRARGADRGELERLAALLEGGGDEDELVEQALDPAVRELAERHPDRKMATVYDPGLRISVDRELARFGAWYEVFPRSTAREPGRHGSFDDVIAYLPYVAKMGFDILYLPPIHPIGEVNRKGRNNLTTSREGDPGSPWAIGSRLGGHKAVNPQLGTLADFRRLVRAAADQGMEIALDIAFQCAPDHPYVEEHPDWFRCGPDGSIRYAENPPKKYEDIYPFDFETEDREALWLELESVIRFWIEQGVRVFRVDNPHTKPFGFWEWLIARTKRDFPEQIFLAEAFTRPHIMGYLAKLGFSQSYTYFTWRNQKQEIVDYFEELTGGRIGDFLRPNLWPNTPDILHEYLQTGGRSAFIVRFVLAATLGASYGIYGPAFELCENEPREAGSEEYLNSEKYELRYRDLDAPHSLSNLIAKVNRLRRENPALQRDEGLRFHAIDNDSLLAYTKQSPDGNTVLVLVNLDPAQTQGGVLEVAWDIGIDASRPFEAIDLLDGHREVWPGGTRAISLDPEVSPVQILRLESPRSPEGRPDGSAPRRQRH